MIKSCQSSFGLKQQPPRYMFKTGCLIKLWTTKLPRKYLQVSSTILAIYEFLATPCTSIAEGQKKQARSYRKEKVHLLDMVKMLKHLEFIFLVKGRLKLVGM